MKEEKERFILKCKVLVKAVTYEDEQSKGSSKVTEDMVFLIPQEGDQRSFFFNKWLPDTEMDAYEIGMEAGHPIHGVFRGCVKRGNRDCKEHHIFVMSRSAEEHLKNTKKSIFNKLKNRYIRIQVLDESEDELVDQQEDFKLPFKKKEYE